MSEVQKLKQQLAKRLGSKKLEWKAVLGRADGTVSAGGQDVYATLYNGAVITLHNDRVPNKPFRKIIVGYDSNDSSLFQVLRLDNVYEERPVPNVGNHKDSHTWYGYDPIEVYGESIMPLLPRVVSGLTVRVYGGYYYANDTKSIMPTTDYDLTAEIPASGAEWVNVEIDENRNVTYQHSASVASKYLLTPANIPQTAADKKLLFSAKMYLGQTEFIQLPGNNDIYDPRFTGEAGVKTFAQLDQRYPLMDIYAIADGDILVWDHYLGAWVNQPNTGGGGDISGTGVIGRVAEFITDTKTIQAANLIAPSANILTLTNNAAATLALNITAGKTLTLTATDNYTLTIPATGTAALLGINNNFTRQQFVDGSQDEIQLRVQAHSTQTTNLQTWENSSGALFASVNGSGRWGLGTTPSTTSRLSSYVTLTETAAAGYYGNVFQLTAQPASSSAGGFHGSRNIVIAQGSQNFTNNITGFQAVAQHNGSGIVTLARGFTASIQLTNTGNITSAVGARIDAPFKTGAGAINNLYGLFIDNQSAGTTSNYAIFTNAGLNELNDQLFVDGSADRIQLRVQAHSTQTTNLQTWENSSGVVQLAVAGNGRDFVLDTTTGSKIGTATTQKLGFWNATPTVQPTTAIAAATFAANTSGIVDDTATFDGYTIGQVVKALRNEGLLA